jgi:hypothetical protein
VLSELAFGCSTHTGAREGRRELGAFCGNRSPEHRAAGGSEDKPSCFRLVLLWGEMNDGITRGSKCSSSRVRRGFARR